MENKKNYKQWNKNTKVQKRNEELQETITGFLIFTDRNKEKGAVKDAIVAEGITDEEGINKAIDEAADKLNISLSEEDRQKINDLMQKIGELDLNVDQLKSQAKQLYDKIGDLNINVSKEEVQGFFAKIIAWIKQLFS